MRRVRYLLLAGLALVGAGRAEESTKSEWTPAEVRDWFTTFAKEAADGERGIHYNGSDTTYHWFTAPSGAGRAARTFKVRRSELTLIQEREFAGDKNGPQGAWSYVDPSRGFVWVPEIGAAAAETRSMEERAAALDAYVEPTPPDKSAEDPSGALIKRAEREFAVRLPASTTVEQKLIFPKPGHARYVAVYVLPGRRTRWVQLIDFHHRDGVWHQYWDVDCAMIVPDPAANPSTLESETAPAK